MGESEVEALLSAWEERLRRIDENLIALESEPTYQMLSGPGRASITGETRQRVEPALAALDEVFMHRTELTSLVSRARERWAERGFWDKEDRQKELTALLAGRSIRLPSAPSPLRQRNLLDATTSDTYVLPDELLERMSSSYRIARDAVSEVGLAWTRLEPVVTALEQDVATARAEADDVGLRVALEGELAALERELAQVRELVATDPFGVDKSVGEGIGPRVRDLRVHTQELARHKASVMRGLGRMAAMLSKIDEATAAAAASAVRATASVRGLLVSEDPSGDERRALLPWREKIEAAASAQHWKSADVGLARWFETASSVLHSLTEVVRRVDRAEAERTELVGLLSARRAQAQVLVARGLIAPPLLEEALRLAGESLSVRPTDMDAARQAVDRYEGLVRSMSKGAAR